MKDSKLKYEFNRPTYLEAMREHHQSMMSELIEEDALEYVETELIAALLTYKMYRFVQEIKTPSKSIKIPDYANDLEGNLEKIHEELNYLESKFKEITEYKKNCENSESLYLIFWTALSIYIQGICYQGTIKTSSKEIKRRLSSYSKAVNTLRSLYMHKKNYGWEKYEAPQRMKLAKEFFAKKNNEYGESFFNSFFESIHNNVPESKKLDPNNENLEMDYGEVREAIESKLLRKLLHENIDDFNKIFEGLELLATYIEKASNEVPDGRARATPEIELCKTLIPYLEKANLSTSTYEKGSNERSSHLIQILKFVMKHFNRQQETLRGIVKAAKKEI